MQGKKSGYMLQKASCWKARQWSAGLEKTPPMMGLGRVSSAVTLTNSKAAYPIVLPSDQIIGRYAKPLARFVESVISAIMLFDTPIFPLRAPSAHRLRMRAQYFVDSPNPIIDSVKPSRPPSKTGLRPMRSDARPHWRTQIASTA